MFFKQYAQYGLGLHVTLTTMYKTAWGLGRYIVYAGVLFTIHNTYLLNKVGPVSTHYKIIIMIFTV